MAKDTRPATTGASWRRWAAIAVLALGTLDCGKAKRPLAPVEISFGTLAVESSPAGATVTIDGTPLDARTPDDFALAAGSHSVSVFLPGHVFEPASTTLAVPADGTVRFLFVEYAPRLVPDATGHEFADQDLGTSSGAWCFEVANRGNVPADSVDLALSGAGADQFAIVSGGQLRDLAPGANQTVCVRFRPTRRGEQRATLAVGSERVDLGGTGRKVACQLAPGESSHEFGSVLVGAPPAAWCFDVTNRDVAACRDTLMLGGPDASQFAIVSGAEIDLAPGATQPVCVAFRPTAAGAASAQIAVGSQAVSLAGTGDGAWHIEPLRALDGTDFDSVCVGQFPVLRLEAKNSGNLPCPLTATGCGRFSVSPASVTVPPGDSVTFEVRFGPESVGYEPGCPVDISDGHEHWPTYFTGKGMSQPLADFSPSSGVVGNAGEVVQFVPDSVENGSPITAYHWDFGDGRTSDDEQPRHLYFNGGVYTVTLTMTNACGESPVASHDICIAEPAYVLLYAFGEGTVIEYTTNVPGWGSTTPLVLYRGTNAGVARLPELVCMDRTTGEMLKAGRDVNSIPRGASEVLGTSGQSFSSAMLPVPPSVCQARIRLTVGGPTSQPLGPTAYARSGACGQVSMGRIEGDSRYCFDKNVSVHCTSPGGDGRIEWGLVAQTSAMWVVLKEVRIEYGCWYVCPQGAPQQGTLTVIDGPAE